MGYFNLALLMGAPAGGGAAASQGSMATSMITFALVIGIFYFLIIRPQNKKQKDTQKMIEAVKKNDKVITIGGIHGVVQSVKDGTVVVKVDDSTKIEFNKSAISTVLNTSPDSKGKGKAKTEEKKEKK